MAWGVYEFLDSRGGRVIVQWAWTVRIQKKARTLLDQKIDLLREHGPDLPPGLLSPGPIDGGHIYKLKVRGPIMLRPLLCKGPFLMTKEYTLLQGAIERGGVLPMKDIEKAEENRQTLVINRDRRLPYEGCSGPAQDGL
jgi:hypothetical protein